MRKIKNPYVKLPGFFCFGCSPENNSGLQMEFYEDEDFICCEWQAHNIFQGYNNVLHGGIQATLIDEIASWVVQVKLETTGVTSRMDIKYLYPVYIDSGPVLVKAKFTKSVKNFAKIDVKLYNSKNELCSTAEVVYYIFDPKEAQQDYFYPGAENFFE
ncbi:MAG: PaaI family thioesterase [Bacteroidales bacterium]|jgi:uncharacterized protein (TIGR00369 family)|nr:PaaI family thioesterase [Bacteroidales bacterium]MDD4213603.1 PaaI family thioesterase [Bacteroidales bacterium]